MAVKKKTKKTQVKAKKKIWVPIFSPKIFGEREVGETTVDEQRKALGKIVTVNLMTLLRDPKKQGINVSFKVTEQHSDHVGSTFYKYHVMPSSIKRMVRRNKDRIDHTFKCKTKGGHTLTIKPIVLTMNKTNNSVQTAIRKNMVSYIFHRAAKSSFDAFIQEIINHKLQQGLKKYLAKLYPIAVCEMRTVVVSQYPEVKKSSKPKTEEKKEEVIENAKAEN